MTIMDRGGPQVRPIRPGLLTGLEGSLDDIHLAGTHCASCGETSLGHVDLCPNCGGCHVRELALADKGKVWSYTVARHRPPGNYLGPEPFAPFGIALVELPDGVRVVSRVDCELDTLHVGLPVVFSPYARQDEDGAIVVTFTYKPVEEPQA